MSTPSRITVETLGSLSGGTAGAVINSAINNATLDLEDRGKDGKPREVTIKLVMIRDDHDRVLVDVQASVKVPSYRTAPTVAQPRLLADGQMALVFQPDNPDRPDQPTFEFPPKGGE